MQHWGRICLCSSWVELKTHKDGVGQSRAVGKAPPLEEPQLLIKQPLLVPVWKTEVVPLELSGSQGFWDCFLQTQLRLSEFSGDI